MAVVAIVITVGAIIFALCRFTILPLWRYYLFLRRVPYSPPTWLPPPIGHTFQIPSESEAILTKISEWMKQAAGKGIFYLWLGPQPILFVTNPQVVEQVLRSPQFNTKGFMYNFLLPWLHTGLLTSTGEKWKRRRKLLTPAFHFAILKSFFYTMRDQVEILMEVIDSSSLTGDKEKIILDAREIITNCTLDIICETAMGVHPNAQKSRKNNKYVNAVKRSNELILKRMTSPFRWPDFVHNLTADGRELATCLEILHSYTEKTIIDRQEELERTRPSWLSHLENNTNEEESEEEERGDAINGKLPLLDLLIATSIYAEIASGVASPATFNITQRLTKRNLDLRGIQEEVDTFMFEGHDTTANALIWSLQRIGECPLVQDKIHEELDRVFADKNRKIEFDDLTQLTYLEMVIKEVLRLYPPVPMLQRRVDKDTLINIDGRELTIPEGVQITVLPYLIHRDESQFPDANDFDPERFSKEALSAGRHAYSYIPFSAGPRNCIGQKFALMEEKTLLVSILRKYRIVSQISSDKIGLKPDLILRPKRPVMIQFIPRCC